MVTNRVSDAQYDRDSLLLELAVLRAQLLEGALLIQALEARLPPVADDGV